MNYEEYEGGKTKSIKQKFLGEGSYGCVWKPGITCSGNSLKDKELVTKITEKNFYSTNELQIGNSLKSIKKDQKIFQDI